MMTRSALLLFSAISALAVCTSPISAQDTDPDGADQQLYQEIMDDAQDAAEDGDFDEAIELWNKSLKYDPTTNPTCKGAKQRIFIQVAREAQHKVSQEAISDDDAMQWFDTRSESLWEDSGCQDN